jgi:hypothetical protein
MSKAPRKSPPQFDGLAPPTRQFRFSLCLPWPEDHRHKKLIEAALVQESREALALAKACGLPKL